LSLALLQKFNSINKCVEFVVSQGIGAAIDYRQGGYDGRGPQGIVVEHVWPGSPAEAHGLQAGDVICLVDGASVQSVEVAKQSIRGPEGSTVALKVQRDGQYADIGPVQRGNWVTIAQVDSNIARLRRLASELRGPQASALSDICGNLTRLRNVLEEERARFQGSMLLSRGRENQAENLAKKLSKALISVSEESAKREERGNMLEQRLHQALDALEAISKVSKSDIQGQGDQNFGNFHNSNSEAPGSNGFVEDGINPRVGALLAALESRSCSAAGTANKGKSPKLGIKLSLLQRRKEAADADDSQQGGIGWVCKELRAALEQEAERYRIREADRAAIAAEKDRLRMELATARAELSRASSPTLSAAPSPLSALVPTEGWKSADHATVPDGWKMCIASGEVFYYSAHTGEVRFSPPGAPPIPKPPLASEPRDVVADAALALQRAGTASPMESSWDTSLHESDHSSPIIRSTVQKTRSRDAIVWGNTRVPGRRATFGKAVNIQGMVRRAVPYLADTELSNTGAPTLRGCVAVIGRGVCTFTEKADRAVKVRLLLPYSVVSTYRLHAIQPALVCVTLPVSAPVHYVHVVYLCLCSLSRSWWRYEMLHMLW
jgi:hypothetical protein